MGDRALYSLVQVEHVQVRPVQSRGPGTVSGDGGGGWGWGVRRYVHTENITLLRLHWRAVKISSRCSERRFMAVMALQRQGWDGMSVPIHTTKSVYSC